MKKGWSMKKRVIMVPVVVLTPGEDANCKKLPNGKSLKQLIAEHYGSDPAQIQWYVIR